MLDALRANDVQALMGAVDAMEARSLSFESALQALASLLHRVALAQLAPAAISDEFEAARLAPYVEAFDAEFLQLAYQIAIHGRDELPLAPDEATGFSMTLLRLFAFRPTQPAALGGVLAGGGGEGQARPLPAAAAPATPRPVAPAPSVAPRPAPAAGPVNVAPVEKPMPRPEAPRPAPPETRAPEPAAAAAAEAPRPTPVVAPPPAPAKASEPDYGSSVPPWEDLPPEAHESMGEPAPRAPEPPPAVVAAPEPVAPEPEPAAPPTPAPASVAAVVAEAAPAAADSGEPLPADIDWHALQEQIGLGGFNLQLAQHSELVSVEGRLLKLRLANDQRHLLQINRSGPEKLQEALSAHFGFPVRVAIEVGEIATVTPAQRNQAEKTERHAAAVVALEQDPFVRELIARFDATLEVASVRPL